MVRRPRRSRPVRRSWPAWQHRRRGALHPHPQRRRSCTRNGVSPAQHLCASLARFEGWYNEVRHTRRWGMRRPTRSSSTPSRQPPQALRARSRYRPTAPVRRHACQLDPRLELDSSWWPRPSEARGTWRRSRSGGPTERCGSGAVAGRGDVCLASERSIEWRASGISETSNPGPKAFSASRSDLVLRAQMSLLSIGECRWTTTPGLPVSRLNTEPVRAPANTSPHPRGQWRMTQGHRGSLFLRCEALHLLLLAGLSRRFLSFRPACVKSL